MPDVSSLPCDAPAGISPCAAGEHGCTVIGICAHGPATTAPALAMVLHVSLAWSTKPNVNCGNFKSNTKNDFFVVVLILLSHGCGHRESSSNMYKHTLHTNKTRTKTPRETRVQNQRYNRDPQLEVSRNRGTSHDPGLVPHCILNSSAQQNAPYDTDTASRDL